MDNLHEIGKGVCFMDTNIQEIWQGVCDIIRKEITEVSYSTWIKPIEPVSMDENKIELAVPNEFTKAILETRYGQLIRNALKSAASKELNINFITTSNGDTQRNLKCGESIIKYGPSSFKLNPLYTFNNFISGESNILAYKAALNIADGKINTFNPLFIYSDAGLGKTHLLQAIGHRAIENDPTCRMMYIKTDEFVNELILSIKSDRENILIENYSRVDLLLFDDFQLIAGKERTQQEFFRIYNSLLENDKRIAVASRVSPESLEFMKTRASSSIDIGLTAEIKGPDYETRLAVLKKLGEIAKVDMPLEALEYIAGNVVSNPRELKNAFNRVAALSVLLNQDIDLKTVQEALRCNKYAGQAFRE